MNRDSISNGKDNVFFREECIVFRSTRGPFGGLSNMAPGFPITVSGRSIRTTEALYQACRFPHLPDLQEIIVSERSPISAKMKSRKFISDTRPDWFDVRIKIMRWCLRVKLSQNWESFSSLLLKTNGRQIVEESGKDKLWGARPLDEDVLLGYNVLGLLLTALRDGLLSSRAEELRKVSPLKIPQFNLFGAPVFFAENSSASLSSNYQATIDLFDSDSGDDLNLCGKELIV